MKKKIKKIIKKVKKIYANDIRLKDVFIERPLISIEGNAEGDFEIKHIIFGIEEQLHIMPKKIIFFTKGEKHILLEYGDFENLLKM